MRSQRLHAVDAVGVAEVNGSLDELCKGYTEERLRVIVFTTEGPHRSIDEIPCLTDFARELHVVWAVVLAVGIGEAVADLGDELIAQAKPKGGVGEGVSWSKRSVVRVSRVKFRLSGVNTMAPSGSTAGSCSPS